MGSVTAQLQLLQQLEGQLLKFRKEKSFVDPALTNARKQFRATAEVILLQNYRVALEKGLENKLWHLCFHRPVQEFRRRIQVQDAKGEKGNDTVAKLKKSFSILLTDGAGFYKGMAYKLQLVYGDMGYKPTTQELGTLGPQIADVKAAAKPMNTSLSVHRCLICIGDLTRYHLQMDTKGKIDWSTADDYYCQAIRVFPEGGNAYNQRAVLAAHDGRDLAAVYNYLRSLAVASPFSIAKENLVQLFEKVRVDYGKLPPPAHGRPTQRPPTRWKLSEITKTVETRFLHLQGLLFTAIDFDNFGLLLKAALSDLDDLLARDAVVKGPQGHGPDRSDLALQQLAALVIYNPGSIPVPSNPSEAEAAKHTALKRSSLDLFFVYTSRLCQVIATVAGELPQGVANSPLLPTVNILLQWIATNPEVLRFPEAESTVGRNFLCKALSEFIVAAAASCEKTGCAPLTVLGRPTEFLQAFPEDFEMRAYSPLLQIQQDLNYSHALDDQEALLPRLKRVIVLLHKIGEGLHAAQATDHPKNAMGGKLVSSYLTKLANSLQPAATQQQPLDQPPAQTDAAADEAPANEEGEEEVIVFNPTPSSAAGLSEDKPTSIENMSKMPQPSAKQLEPMAGNQGEDSAVLPQGRPATLQQLSEILVVSDQGKPIAPQAVDSTQAAAVGVEPQLESVRNIVSVPSIAAQDETMALNAKEAKHQAEWQSHAVASTGISRTTSELNDDKRSNALAEEHSGDPLLSLAAAEISDPAPQFSEGRNHVHVNAQPKEQPPWPWHPSFLNPNVQQLPSSKLAPESRPAAQQSEPPRDVIPSVLAETRNTLSRQEPAISSGVTDYVQRLDALAESGATEEVQPGASLTTLLHRPSQETYNILSSRSNTPLLPNLGGSVTGPPGYQRVSSTTISRPTSRLAAALGPTSRVASSFEASIQAPVPDSAFQGPWQGIDQSAVSGPYSSTSAAVDLLRSASLRTQNPSLGISSAAESRGLGTETSSDNQLAAQLGLPASAWSVGPGSNLPSAQPQDMGSLQEQLLLLKQGMTAPKSQPQHPSLGGAAVPHTPYDPAGYSSNLQRAIAQMGRPAQAPLPPSLVNQTGQYPYSQLPSRLPQNPQTGSNAQIQALLAQLGHTRQPASLGQTPYQTQQLGASQQSLTGLPLSLQLQLAQAREPPRGYSSALGNQLHGYTPGIPAASPASINTSLPGLQQMQPQLAGLTPLQYQTLLRSLGPGQLEQMMRPTANPNPSPAPPNPLGQFQSYLGAGGQQPRTGTFTGQSAIPAQAPNPSSLQYQMMLNSLNAQKPMVLGRPTEPPGGISDFAAAGSRQFSHSPGAQAPMQPAGPRLGEPNISDYRRLQQLLAAGGKELPTDVLLKLQRELGHQALPVKSQASEQDNSTNPEIQRFLASLNSIPQPKEHSMAQSRTEAKDPMAELQKQLSAQNESQQGTHTETSDAPGSKALVASPFAREACNTPWDRVAQDPASRQQSPAPAQQNRWPSATHSDLKGLMDAASEQFANQGRQLEEPVQLPGQHATQHQEEKEVARLPQDAATASASDVAVQQCSEPQRMDWGPFTGLGSDNMGGPWSHPWGPASSGVDPPKPPGSGWSHFMQNLGPKGDTQAPPVDDAQVGNLSNFFRATNSQQKLGDSDWQAQLASLQSASRGAQELTHQNRGLQGNSLGQAPSTNPDLYSKQATVTGISQWLGSTGELPEPQLDKPSQNPYQASLFQDFNRQSGNNMLAHAPEPVLPSWLQTSSQGSGVWGAPANQPPPASSNIGMAGQRGASTWLATMQQQQQQQQQQQHLQGHQPSSRGGGSGAFF